MTFEVIEASPDFQSSCEIEKVKLIPITVGLDNNSMLILKSDVSRDTTQNQMHSFKQFHDDMIHDMVDTLHKISRGELKWPDKEETHMVEEPVKEMIPEG